MPLSYGDELIFNNINFKINKNEKIALIGRNGCGKSTILKIINGQLFLDSGLIFLQQNLSIGYLAQTHFEDLNNTVLDEMLLCFQELRNLEEELVSLSDKLNVINPKKMCMPMLESWMNFSCWADIVIIMRLSLYYMVLDLQKKI